MQGGLLTRTVVIALDNCATRLALARHNAAIYGVADRIEFILTDYLSFARAYLSVEAHRRARTIDVVFLSPPWGGPSYLQGSGSTSHNQSEIHASSEENLSEYSLASIKPVHGAELFRLSRQITSNVAFYLPRNSNLEEIGKLVEKEEGEEGEDKVPDQKRDKSALELVEVEEEWMGPKLKALTCYFGGLVAGQERLF
jgi:trimethylguanosine synthase